MGVSKHKGWEEPPYDLAMGDAAPGHEHRHEPAPVRAPEGTPGSLPLPPVERVRPGLWSIPVPIPSSSLRYVFVYAFETNRGIYLVDVGWNTDDAYSALTDGLAQMGGSLGDVAGVMVTHIHPDHYGLAGRVREASGAWVSLHPADAALVQERYGDTGDLLTRVGNMLATWGAPASELEELKNASMPVRNLVELAVPDVLLDDGERPEVPGWDLSAIWTPGHSPGHLCFWEGNNRLLLAGDHVLPRITPNIPFHPQASANPLGDFLASLDKVGAYQPDEVLPAHEHRFVDLAGRIAELHHHHETRFAEVLAAIADGVTTTWDIAQRMSWSRPWQEIQGFMRRAAVSEASSHLRALQHRGVIRVLPYDLGQPAHWEIVGA